MNGIFSLAGVLLIAAFAAGQARGPSVRIVGGESTTIERYPSLVQMDSLGIFSGIWSQGCGANILTSRFVLSAAHCFAGTFYAPEYRRIRAGATYRNTDGWIHNVDRAFNHPSYGTAGMGYDGDITVVRLLTALVYNPVVQPGTILAQGAVVPDNSVVVHSGWGTLHSGGPQPEDLQHVQLYTINHKVCRDNYLELNELENRNYFISDNMICAGELGVGGRDACQGDSGGPLYYGEIIVGIVSWGHGCANETYPGVNTAVGPYSNWIIDVVNTNQ